MKEHVADPAECGADRSRLRPIDQEADRILDGEINYDDNEYDRRELIADQIARAQQNDRRDQCIGAEDRDEREARRQDTQLPSELLLNDRRQISSDHAEQVRRLAPRFALQIFPILLRTLRFCFRVVPIGETHRVVVAPRLEHVPHTTLLQVLRRNHFEKSLLPKNRSPRELRTAQRFFNARSPALRQTR